MTTVSTKFCSTTSLTRLELAHTLSTPRAQRGRHVAACLTSSLRMKMFRNELSLLHWLHCVGIVLSSYPHNTLDSHNNNTEARRASPRAAGKQASSISVPRHGAEPPANAWRIKYPATPRVAAHASKRTSTAGIVPAAPNRGAITRS